MSEQEDDGISLRRTINKTLNLVFTDLLSSEIIGHMEHRVSLLTDNFQQQPSPGIMCEPIRGLNSENLPITSQ